MQVFMVLIAVAHGNINHSYRRNARQAEVDEKRFSELKEMMLNYNADFDERTYFAYGCNCMMLGKFQFQLIFGDFKPTAYIYYIFPR